MKIIIVGATGTIGQAVVEALSPRHEIVRVGFNNGDVQADITDIDSIKKMYQQIGAFDALVATTGQIHFAPLTQMSAQDYQLGLNNKVMGQVNLVLQGLQYINDQGSFTLTSGVLSDDPVATGSSASMVNAAIDGFVKGAAIEMPRAIRINSVSPTVITESLDQYAAYFRGFESVSCVKAAKAYSKSVEGLRTGQIFSVWG